MSNTMDDLTARALALANARADIGRMVQALQAGIDALRADKMPEIREAIDKATAAWTHLEQGIQASPHLFIKPRTVAAHGITFGIEKGKGAIKIAEPDKTIALIRKHLPDQAKVLIKTKETPVKKAIAQLAAADLKRVGVEIGAAGDQVVIRPAPSDVDKLVKALVSAELGDDEVDES